MNRNTSIALLGAVFAVTAGMLSVNAFSATPFLVAQSASTTHDDALIQGHVTYLVKDSDGEIKRYIQSDNLVVNVGETCVATSMFKSNDTINCDTNQSTSAGTSTTNGFNWIAIGNGTDSVDATDTILPVGGTAGGEKQRLQSLAAIGNSTGPGATATMSKTFSFSAGTATTIRNSGLFDRSGTDAGHMFAHQAISVPVGASDTLTVTWTITLGS